MTVTFVRRVLARLLAVSLLLVLLLGLLSPAAMCAAADDRVVAAALKEGNLYIYGSLDKGAADRLIKEFIGLYPGIKVDFISLPPVEVFSRHMRDLSGRRVSADILWNSDITLQANLVRDGYALPYRPAVSSEVMPQALLADTAFVTAFEPVVFAYNRKLVATKDLPLTRKLLLKALEKPEWQGKLATCDPEKNARALLLLTQDLAYGTDFWGMVTRLGKAGLKIFPDYNVLLESLARGEVLAGYNLPLSEVLKRGATDDTVGWLYLNDYDFAIPQSALITKAASNPNAARLWIDFILSARAQQIVAESSDLFPVARNVVGGAMKKSGGELPSGAVLKMVGIGTEVSRFSDRGLKSGFVLRWQQKLKLVK